MIRKKTVQKSGLILLFWIFGLSSVKAQDCSILKNNSFTYTLAKQEVLVEFNDDTYVEYHNDKKYFIKSAIEWLSDCEYNLTIQEISFPDFPFEPGAKLHTKILKVKKNKIYYESTLAGRTWKGKMTKVKAK